jgi:hypothetical protein
MRLVIDDGYTLPFTTQEQLADPITGRVIFDNLPPVAGRYRPALFSENEEFQWKVSHATSGKEVAELSAGMIAAHVTDWDAQNKDGSTAKIEVAVILRMPPPIVRQLLDIVTTWAPKEQEKAAGNSPAASGSPS